MPCRCLIGYCLRRRQQQQQQQQQLREPLVVVSLTEQYDNHYDVDDDHEETRSPIIINTHSNKNIVLEQDRNEQILDNFIEVHPDIMGRRNITNQPSLAQLSDEHLNDLQKLEKHFPLSTLAERHRFLNAKAGKYDVAFEQMKHYMEWRERYDLDHVGLTIVSTQEDEDWKSCASSDGTMDEIDWKCASDKALSYEDRHPDRMPSTLPQLVRILTIPGSDDHLTDREGHRILHLLPAQMDPHVASHDTFALCIAFYLERKLGRDTMEKMTVVIDVRAGYGWANPRPNKLIPFIKGISSLMERNFPERLSKSILFPLPRAATVIWGVIKKFLDPNTAEKIAVISGDAGTDAPPPFKKMEVYMERKVIDRMEAIRIDSFNNDDD